MLMCSRICNYFWFQDIVIATPGRLKDLIEMGVCCLSDVSFVVSLVYCMNYCLCTLDISLLINLPSLYLLYDPIQLCYLFLMLT